MKKCSNCGCVELLTYEQKELALIKGLAPLTSATLAKKLKLSASNSSNKLIKWWRSGFLTREAHADPTGGVIYLYSEVKNGKAEKH